MDKKGQNKKFPIDPWMIAVGVILIYLFNLGGFQGWVNDMVPGNEPVAPVTPEITGATCQVEDTSVTVSSHSKYAAGTIPSGSAHRYFIEGADQGYVADKGSFTASPGDNVIVILNENATDFYSQKMEFQLPCKGTYRADGGVAAIDTSMDIVTWSSSAVVQSAVATGQEPMDASASYEIPIRVKTTSKYSYGNPDSPGAGNVMCFNFNTTVFNSFALDGATSAPTPQAQAASAGHSSSCYYFPVVANDPEVDDGQFDGTINIETAGTAPQGSNSNTTVVYLYDVAADLDADTLAWINNVEDEDKNDLGDTQSQNATIWVS